MDVFARPTEPTVAVAPGTRAWQTRFADLMAAPSNGDGRSIQPVAIPVVGSRPIEGRRLVRAPWPEPLAAFAGVIVETQLVPVEWLRPRSAASRIMDPPTAPPQPGIVPAPASDRATVDGLVAIRVARDAGPLAHPTGTRDPRTSAAPSEPVAPSARLTRHPAPARRGLLARAVAISVGLVLSLVAFEAANRMGRR